jgi:hypothetical protein
VFAVDRRERYVKRLDNDGHLHRSYSTAVYRVAARVCMTLYALRDAHTAVFRCKVIVED